VITAQPVDLINERGLRKTTKKQRMLISSENGSKL
jgi:hypothetical protein